MEPVYNSHRMAKSGGYTQVGYNTIRLIGFGLYSNIVFTISSIYEFRISSFSVKIFSIRMKLVLILNVFFYNVNKLFPAKEDFIFIFCRIIFYDFKKINMRCWKLRRRK